MNWLGLIFVAAGAFSVCGAAFDWEWFMNSYRARFFVAILGRSGARIFYALLGLAFIVFGILFVLGVIADSS